MIAGIVGAGAMGSLFSGFFHRGGIECVVYERDRATVDALDAGLLVRMGMGSEHRIPVRVSPDPAILHACDAIFIFVKSYATAGAARDIAPHLGEGAVVVSLQNGLGNREQLERELPGVRLVYGTTTIGGYREGPSTVVLGGMGEIVIGGADDKALDLVRGMLGSAGLDVHITPRPDVAVWKKAVINAGINPLGALAGLENGRLLENEHLSALQESIIRESVAVAMAGGISLDPDDMIAAAREVCEKTAANRCSMLQDLDARRKTEIDSINGHIIRAGLKHGVRAPYNEAVYRLVKAREG